MDEPLRKPPVSADRLNDWMDEVFALATEYNLSPIEMVGAMELMKVQLLNETLGTAEDYEKN